MFILPANEKDDILTASLQGMAKAGNILDEKIRESNKRHSREEAMKSLSAGKFDVGAILKADLHPQETAALLQYMQNMPHPSTSGRPPSGLPSPSSTGSGSSMGREELMARGRIGPDGRITRGTGQGMLAPPYSEGRSEGLPQAEGQQAEGLPPPQKQLPWDFIQTSAEEDAQARWELGTKAYDAREKKIAQHNTRIEHLIKENQPIRDTVHSHAKSGEQLVADADTLEGLVRSGDLMSPMAAWFQQKTGLPISSLGNINDEVFSKVVNGLLGPYLRENFGGLGRVLLAEVESQKRAIVSATNSDEAKMRLIDLIRGVGQAGIDSGEDYKGIVAREGRGYVGLADELRDRAHDRWENSWIHYTTSDGQTMEIQRKDRSAVMKIDDEQARKRLQPKINKSPALHELHDLRNDLRETK
jgi:hypothetical protein